MQGYYRFPSIYKDTVVFVSEDDLWKVSLHGGTAARLTSNLSQITHPVISPDGKYIAFTGSDEGHPEVYIMPLRGGTPQRLT
ncbi:PD40 domain-containing protein, partial [candidate division WOR-3 bacterium]|nr:PD40 domain-containing protein [candidate division WOR-3 bacterium]